MSLRSSLGYSLPEETARVARAAFPRGNPYLRLADALGPIFSNPDFADLYPKEGQPAEDPAQLALVTLFQFAEGLTDRQAADAVRSRINWKYALCLPLEDEGFDSTVLVEFRARLLAGGAERRLFDALLDCLKAHGFVKAGGRQRTDSTHVLAAARDLRRLECAGETLRHTLNALATAAPAWLRAWAPAEWYERYGQRLQEYRLPKGLAARQALAERIGADGRRLLDALDAPAAPAGLGRAPAVRTLRRVWLEQYHAGEPVRWRAADDLPPAARMIASPHDPDARTSRKRETAWTGYKVHLTETCDDDAPHLIVPVETTPATTPDWHLPAVIHPALAAKGPLPGEHRLDAGYGDSEVLVSSRTEHAVRVIGPVPPDNHWQARAGQGFDIAGFTINWETRRAACPQGQPSAKWAATHGQRGEPLINIRFSPAACRVCAQRAPCTTSRDGPRVLSVRPQAQHEALQAARRRQTTPEFEAEYARRAGIEGTVAQGLRVRDLRRARYAGLAKVRLQHVLTAAGLNLRRLAAWWDERPLAQTRIAPFVKLTRAAAA
jgi:transposase